MNSYCIVLAGGTGSRMGCRIPKQFLELSGVPIIVRTIKRVLECQRFLKVIIVIHPEWRERLFEVLSCENLDLSRVVVALGGKERLDSIINALSAIHSIVDVDENDVVVIHEAVRPFVSVAMLEDSINTASKYGACVATTPAIDTMLQVDNDVVVSVPKRSSLFHGQAPDSAKLLLLERAIGMLSGEEFKTITGTAQILFVKGIPVRVIKGDVRNIKITTQADMDIAEKYVEEGY